MNEASAILEQIDQRDPSAADALLPLVYEELRRVASRKMSQDNSGQTLSPTALVHEAYLRLVDAEHPQAWQHRRHFVAAESALQITTRVAARSSATSENPSDSAGSERSQAVPGAQ